MSVFKMILSVVVWASAVLTVSATPVTNLGQSLVTNGSVYCGSLDEPTILTYGDVDDGGPGFILADSDMTTPPPHYFFLYENSRDTHPWKYAVLNPGTEIFISVCPTFAGRVVRGNPAYNLDGGVHNLGTWVELSLEGPPSAAAWGDISLLQGCDGAATVAAMDGSGISTGFTQDMITGAPAVVLMTKADGSVAIAKTVGEGANEAAREYELSLLDPMKNASIIAQYTPVIESRNGRFLVTMYYGTF